MEPAKRKGIVWLGAALLFAAVCRFGYPYAIKFIPWSFERGLGNLIPNIYSVERCDKHPERNELLHRVVQRIYPLYPEDALFEINVSVASVPEINAFATLGGNIYVLNELLEVAESPDELAGVLAHEIEHVRHRHILEGVLARLVTGQLFALIWPDSSTAGSFAEMYLKLQFSREQESEADAEGVTRLRAAQVDATGLQHFFERLAKMPNDFSLLSDHPAGDDRAEQIRALGYYPTTPILTDEEWSNLKKICD